MTRILGIQLRRSAALGAALLIAVSGTIVLHSTVGRWSTGWMALVMTQREYLAVMSPVAMAAGAWQSYREHRADVAELFTSVPRPRRWQIVPVLVTTGAAAPVAYLVALLAAAPRIAGTARYLPPAAFAVVAVGLVAMIASVWLGLAVGRLVPALATGPALAVIGYVLLVLAPHVFSDHGLMAAFSPMGMGAFSAYDTVGGRVSLAQGLWTTAIATAGVVLFAARKRKVAFAALVPLAIGATATALVVPTGDAYARQTLDRTAQELVCTSDAPRVCVSRAHEGVLSEVVPKARRGLALLSATPVVEAHEDTSTISPPTSPRPRAGTALMDITIDKHGHLADPGRLEPHMLTGVFFGPLSCQDARHSPDPDVGIAAAYWLLDREPTAGPDRLDFDDPEAVKLWKGLKALPPAEAGARVTAVYRAAQKCQDTTGLLTRSPR